MSKRKILLRSLPLGVGVLVAGYGSEALTEPGTTRWVVMLVLFAVTSLVVGFAVDAVAGDRDH
ncbi:hypothetical protein ACWD4O_46920 [Streptomyces sp. NPDC002623]